MAPVSLASHLALAKNVRGLGVYDPEDPPERPFFTWLSRKHQYRAVGFPPALWEHPTVEIADYETFERLEPPDPEFAALIDDATVDTPEWVIESLMIASAYVVPVFLHRAAAPAFEPFVRWRLETDEDLPEDQILRHVRILGYGMLDFFESSTEEAWESVQQGTIEQELDRRRRVAGEDGRDRCWRLLEDAFEGDTWVGGYFDVLPAANAEAIADLDRDAAIGLGFVGGFIIDPPYED